VPYTGEFLLGFATDEAGIRCILCNHWREYRLPLEGLEITVDMEAMQCQVKDTKGYTYLFSIHPFERATA